MSASVDTIRELAQQEYKWGFVTEIDEDRVPKGLNEDIVRLISERKGEPEWMLEWRLKALRHWFEMAREEGEPKWANVKFGPIDYQNIVYYSAPKQKAGAGVAGRHRSGDPAAPTRSWAFRWTSRSCWPAWPWTRCLTASRWRRPSRASWRRWA